MVSIRLPRPRGFCSRPELSSQNLSFRFLVHLREHTRLVLPESRRTVIADRLDKPEWTGALPGFQ